MFDRRRLGPKAVRIRWLASNRPLTLRLRIWSSPLAYRWSEGREVPSGRLCPHIAVGQLFQHGCFDP